jgi:hypothetical protein
LRLASEIDLPFGLPYHLHTYSRKPAPGSSNFEFCLLLIINMSSHPKVDYETSVLVARLAIDDLENVYGRRWGKSRAGAPLSDEEYAMRLQMEQFQEWITTEEDARLANSLREASSTDAAYLEALTTAEQAATEDRRAALALSRGEALPLPTNTQARLEDPAFNMHPEPPVYTSFLPCIGGSLIGLTGFLFLQNQKPSMRITMKKAMRIRP